MVLVFNKVHAVKLEEELSYKYMFGQLSKSANVTSYSFNWNACINGRFERKLQKFINKLPFVYFSVIINRYNDTKNKTGKSLNKGLHFKQGECNAKEIKKQILKVEALHTLKLTQSK